MNQRLRPLQSSTNSNLVDPGWNSIGLSASPWMDRSLLPQADGSREASAKTAMYLKQRCRGVAGHLRRQTVNSERGNRIDFIPEVMKGQAHGRLVESMGGGASVVVRGGESPLQGEGRQQASSSMDGRR